MAKYRSISHVTLPYRDRIAVILALARKRRSDHPLFIVGTMEFVEFVSLLSMDSNLGITGYYGSEERRMKVIQDWKNGNTSLVIRELDAIALFGIGDEST